MKAFVTGGSGFIGGHVILKLLQRGYEVHALVRSEKDATAFEATGVRPVWGDILNIDSMRAGIRDMDVLFHLAGWYEIGARDKSMAKPINVDGTRNVLELAHELKVPKIIYTSTVAVFGDTGGRLVDEDYVMPPYQNFLTEYDRTKWMAHYEVAQPMIRKGAPIIITMPGVVYGPGDTSLVGSLMRMYYLGLIPVVPGPEFTLTYAHVEDIAEGLVLAAEKGDIGQSYILAGPAVPLGEMITLWASILNRNPPSIGIPARYLRRLAPTIAALTKLVPLPEIISQDTVNILEASYAARSDKARRELGWETRPLEAGMAETFEWISRNSPKMALNSVERRRLATVSLVAALVLLGIWLRNQGEG